MQFHWLYIISIILSSGKFKKIIIYYPFDEKAKDIYNFIYEVETIININSIINKKITKNQVKFQNNKTKNKEKNLNIMNQLSDFLSRIPVSMNTSSTSPEEDKIIPKIEDYNHIKMLPETKKKIKELKNITEIIENKSTNYDSYYSKDKKFIVDYKNDLNQAQFIAATTIKGPVLVIAGAGSGKTRTIVYRVSFLIENNIPPENILLLTFTRKAAKEMMERASTLLGYDKNIQINGGTFHSIANNLLRKFSGLIGLNPNFTILDKVDSQDVVDLIKKELNIRKKGEHFPRKDIVFSIISKSRNRKLTIDEIINKEYTGLKKFRKKIEIIGEVYTIYKEKNNLFDYDDLLEKLYFYLKNNSKFLNKVQEKYKYIMVDEFQDTNIIQKKIVDLLAMKYRNIMVVGDDFQSIYSFRGTNFENILLFPKTYPDCKIVKIEQNYRSKQDILSFTNDIIHNAKIGYKKELFSKNSQDGIPLVRRFYNQEDEAQWIISKIFDLQENGVEFNNIAVIYRASFHSNFIQAELLKRSIPYVVYGGIKFSERRHVKDIVSYLRIILNPVDAVSWNRILKLIPGIGDTRASRIVEHIYKKNGKIDFKEYHNKKYFNDLNDIAEILNKISKQSILPEEKIEILKDYYKPVLKEYAENFDRRLLDIDVLISLAKKYKNLEKFLTDFALDPPSNKIQSEFSPMINEDEEGKIILTTVHSAKGLEWQTVFIPHLIDGLFPDSRSMITVEMLEEERRLFYVACTRAKNNLYLSFPSRITTYSGIFSKPSRFISEISKKKYTFSL